MAKTNTKNNLLIAGLILFLLPALINNILFYSNCLEVHDLLAIYHNDQNLDIPKDQNTKDDIGDKIVSDQTDNLLNAPLGRPLSGQDIPNIVKKTSHEMIYHDLMRLSEPEKSAVKDQDELVSQDLENKTGIDDQNNLDQQSNQKDIGISVESKEHQNKITMPLDNNVLCLNKAIDAFKDITKSSEINIVDIKDNQKLYSEYKDDLSAFETLITKIIQKEVSLAKIIIDDDKKFLIMATNDEIKIIITLISNNIILGDVYNAYGVNLTKSIADKNNAQTILDIFSNTINGIKKVSSVRQDKSLVVSDEIYDILLNTIPGKTIDANKSQKPAIIMLSSESCYHCSNIEDKINKGQYDAKIKIINIDKLSANDLADNKSECTDSKDVRNFLANITIVPSFIWKDKSGINRVGNFSLDSIINQI